MGGGRYFILGMAVAIVCTVEDETVRCKAVSRNCSSVGVTLALTRALLSVGWRSVIKRGDVNRNWRSLEGLAVLDDRIGVVVAI